MKKWYAFETRSWGIIDALEKSLRQSSVLSRLRDGLTPAKERGKEMADAMFPDLDRIKACDEVLSNQVRRDGVLYYQDEEYAMYMYKGDIYVLEPLTFDDTLERAVIEAGFATEELRHALKECYECLYLRMMADGMEGFSEKEWQAVLTAKELLGLGAR